MRRPNALQLFRAGMLALVLASTALGAMTLTGAFEQRARANASLEELATFSLAFDAAVAIAEERRPLETALSNTRNTDGLATDLIATSRAHSDAALLRFEHRAKATGLDQQLNFNFLRMRLKAERARVDSLLSMPLTARPVGLQVSIVRGMSSISETIAPMIVAVCRRVEKADPNLGGKVGVVWLLASMYESALRLPSEVVPYLATGAILSTDAQMQAQRITQRIRSLWDVGEPQLGFSRDEADIGQLIARIQGDYLNRGLPYLTRQVELNSYRVWKATPSAAQILEVYQSTADSIAELRDVYLAKMVEKAKAHDQEALVRMIMSFAMTLLILLGLPLLVWSALRQILRPLLDFRDQILAVSERREVETKPYTGSVPQVQSLFQALQTLRERERERIVADTQRAALSERLRLLSVTDELTGLLNRRGFDAARQSGPPSHLAQSTKLALVTLDIDHFKAVNDTFGHKSGDLVLQAISRVLDTEVGLNGLVGRYGGEEFVVLLWYGELFETQMLTERLRARIEATDVAIGDGLKPIRVTASFGIAFSTRDELDWNSLHQYSDEALYAAKQAGRNRVRITNRIVSTWSDRAPRTSTINPLNAKRWSGA
ncbi:hypothetical protein NS226_22260 [Aureimonas ureilytica]|uniref:diguanylate cyclase n=1 Tax=Aureimonas ureilytica TaxID=401562 RepID=A0A175R299_9HYPH|nr:GGDEF domain-containing protein [Aureimonas ureilytica]KTQ82323.1 hypothetical protein NS226_22260 [Aureimonas ureilytica]